MPKGELFFRRSAESTWHDMYEEYGISFASSSLSQLMTPAPNKEGIENKSRRQNGKRVIRDSKYAKKDERDVNLEMHLSAPSETVFWQRYHAFCTDFLDYGYFDIKTEHAPGNIFRMTYLSCTQFSEFMRQLAKFMLRLNEPDPSNRGITDSWDA